MLSKQDQRNLNKINKILKESFGFTTEVNPSLGKTVISNLKTKAQKNMSKIVESSEFNTYHRSKEYNQCLLIVEATNILLNKKATQSELDEIVQRAHNESRVVTPSDKYNELKGMYEKYVTKHGMTKVAEGMKEKLNSIEKEMYNENISSKLSLLLKEDADKAEAIMSAKGLLDDLLGYQSKIGETQNKYLDPFIEMVRSEYSNEMADEIYNKLNDSLSDLLAQVRDTKEVFANVVGVLSGQGELEDTMVEPEGDENLDADDGLGDEGAGSSDEEMPELDLGSDDEGSEEDSEEQVAFDPEEKFKRKEE